MTTLTQHTIEQMTPSQLAFLAAKAVVEDVRLDAIGELATRASRVNPLWGRVPAEVSTL